MRPYPVHYEHYNVFNIIKYTIWTPKSNLLCDWGDALVYSIQQSNNRFSGRAITREDNTLGAGHGQATTPKDAAS